MKKRIIFTLLVLYCIGLNAQNLSIGINFGISGVKQKYTSSGPIPVEYRFRPSYYGGAIIKYKIIKPLDIQIEPGFIEKGSGATHNTSYKFGYLSSPIILVIKPIKGFNIELGTELSYLIYYKTREDGKISNYTLNSEKRKEISGLLGIRCPFDKYAIVARYSHSFTPVIDSFATGDPFGPLITYKIYNYYFGLGIQYYFSSGKK